MKSSNVKQIQNPMIAVMIKKALLGIVIFLFAIFQVQNTKAQVATQDSLALVELYNSTNGPGWTNKTNWLTGPVKNWYGVEISNKRVTSLIMNRNNLIGSIPAFLGNLNSLQNLILSNNQLTGNIPQEIGNLTSLVYLYLNSNNINGSIPPQFGNLSSLQSLRLNDNQLNGSIPSEIGSLSNLTILCLNNNQLIGSLPSALWNLTKITQLDLNFNQISGQISSEISKLKTVKFLNLDNNQLSGQIPSQFGDLSSLITTNLSNNQLIGIIPSSIGNLTNLQTIYLVNNNFTNLPALPLAMPKYAQISSNQFTFDDIIPNLFHLATYSPQNTIGTPRTKTINSGTTDTIQLNFDNNITTSTYQWYKNGALLSQTNTNYLTISNASIADAGSYTCNVTNSQVSGLTLTTAPISVIVKDGVNIQDSLALVALYNSTNGPSWTNKDNWLTGPVNTWYGVRVSDSRVIGLDLNSNNLVGSIPFSIGSLNRMKNLNLSYNQLSGEIPISICDLNVLEELHLGSNTLTGNIPRDIGNLTYLNNLYLFSNQLTGEIPSSIGNLINLKFLNLNTNQLTGNIPKELGNISGLNFLHLYSNQLSGEIPLSFGNLSSLLILYLSSNQLTGNIPMSLGNLTSLKQLLLDQNQLSGEIPISLGNLSSLNQLYLNENRLTGNIPTELGNITSLTLLYLGKNQLSGEIPSSLGNLTNLKNLSLFFNNLSGQIPEQIGKLTKLEWLLLDHNKLSGIIPSQLCNLRNLISLGLAKNELTEKIPLELKYLTSLVSLDLSQNALTGQIPPEIGTLNNLSNLWLNSNKLSDSVPSQIGNLKVLQILDLSYNQLSHLPLLPNSLSKSALVISNQFTFEDIIPNQSNIATYSPQNTIGSPRTKTINSGTTDTIQLNFDNDIATSTYQWYKNGTLLTQTSTNYLTISNASVADAGSYTCNVTNSQVSGLTLTTAPITVFIKDVISMQDSLALVALYNNTNGPSWTNKTNWLIAPVKTWYGVGLENNRVATLGLANNQMSGTIPAEIGNLTALQALYLGYNQLSGSIPAEIGNLTKLQYLELPSNQLSGSIPAEIGNLTTLQDIGLSDNQLSGPIPAEIGNLTAIRYLSLYKNQLSGSIPAEIGNLTALPFLVLSENQLSGSIPAEIGNLAALHGIWLNNNQLSGQIPSEIGNLEALQGIWLNNNQLSGSIPIEIGNLTALQYIDLSENQLNGSIPSEIGNLAALQNIRLSDNQFSGPIPTEIGNLTALQDIAFSNNQFTSLPTLPIKMSKYSMVQSNQLTFDDIIPNLSHLYQYSPQNTIGTPRTKTIYSGTNDTIQLNFDNDITTSTYTWYKNGSQISQTSTNYLTINNVTIADTGSYTCSVTNSQVPGLTLSIAPIEIEVQGCPQIINQPASLNLDYGSATFSVTANGATSYQWRKNGINISDANAATYTIPDISKADGGYYDVVVSNSSNCSVTSDMAILTFKNCPVITKQPVDVTEPTGSDATIKVEAAGSNLSYQWYVNGIDIFGENKASYTTNNPNSSGGNFRVWVTRNGCITKSVAVTITFVHLPTGETIQTFNSSINPTINELVVTGASIKWYSVATGGNELTLTTPLVNGAIYYASQTINGVESDRLAVKVEVSPNVSGATFAGTSSEHLILKSIDEGQSFTQTNFIPNGDPSCFCKGADGAVYMGTRTGWVYKYSGGSWDEGREVVNPEWYPLGITLINISNIWGGTYIKCLSSDQMFYANILDLNFMPASTHIIGNATDLLSVNGTDILFTTSGIFVNYQTQPTYQDGNFTCAFDAGNGFIYAGTADGNIWRNTIANSYNAWTNLGNKTGLPDGSPILSIKMLNNRRICYSVDQIGVLITDDEFTSFSNKLSSIDKINAIEYLGNSVALIGADNGHIYRSIDNGETFTDLGQQFGQASINCLIRCRETTSVRITSQPSSVTKCEGIDATFNASATGVNLTYQWQVSTDEGITFNSITSAGTSPVYSDWTTPTLQMGHINTFHSGYQFRCVISDTYGSTNSEVASITVNPKPNQPSAFTISNDLVCKGQNNVIYTVPNDTSVSYNWLYTGTGADLKGTSNSINISFDNTATSGTLSVTATNECGASEARELGIIVNSGPTITTHPTEQTACESTSKTFSVRAAGTGLTYQWQNSADGGNTWNDIAGATANNYTVKAAITMDGYLYQCAVSSNACPSYSKSAKLNVTPSAKINLPLANQSACEGGVASFTVDASGIALTYQWQAYINNNWTDLVGATGTTYTETDVSASMNGRLYHCIVKGTCGMATSSAARLTVNLNPVIDIHPYGQTICENSTKTFSVKAHGYNLAYQWQNSTDNGITWNNITNATAANYSIKASMPINGYLYHCTVSGGCGTAVTSGAAKITVTPIVRIILPPAYQTICEGGNVTFSVTASGEELTYQWQSYLANVWTDIPGATSSACEVTATASMNGRLYHCVVKGTCGSATTTNAKLTVNLNPSISTPPADLTICENSTKTFTIKATGYALTYQWQNSTDAGITWNNIAGATTVNCSVKATLAMDNYLYHCVVTGGCGAPVTSSAAKITVTPLAKITTHPVSHTVCEGTTVSFAAEASGNNLTYQWQSYIANVWTDINGATNPTYSVTASSALNGRLFHCLAKGTCNTATTASARLTVNLAPQITLQPANQPVCDGITASFKITATGAGLTYQWQSYISNAWTNITGARSATYNIKATPALHGRYYQCVVTGTCGTATSNTVQLTLGPQITADPTNQIVCENSTATFGAIAAIGIGPFTYQWQQSIDAGNTWNAINNATNSSYNVNAILSINGYQYRCIVSGSCGYAATSKAAKLNINALPQIGNQPLEQTICEDQQVNMSVTASGPQLTYQWKQSTDDGNTWNNINGATNSSYTPVAINAMNDNQYRCIVSSVCTPSATSDVAKLKVIPKTTIISQTAERTICEDNIATFNVSVNGTDITYQWQNSMDGGNTWNNIVGETKDAFSINAIPSINGNLYRCVINGNCGTVNSYAAPLTVISKTQIITPPADQSACEESSATFSISATGNELTYQWQYSIDAGNTWNDLIDETDETCRVSTSIEMNGYQYHCVINSSCGVPVTSYAAKLTVNPLPMVINQPTNQVVCEGTIASFSIETAGSNLTYQWQSFINNAWEDIVDANNATYSEIATSSMNGQRYRCVINGVCSKYSDVVGLTVNTAPFINTQPDNVTACDGGPSVIGLIATGYELTYQWQQSADNGSTWSDIAGATNNATILSASAELNGYMYHCVIGGSCGSMVTSNNVQLTVPTDQKFTTQPANQKVAEGANALFSVGVEGTNITYQWQNNLNGSWSNIDGASNNTYQVSASESSAGSYRCVVSNICNSNEADLILARAPVIVTQPAKQMTCVGTNATFTVDASGFDLVYQWQKNTNGTWIDISGATDFTYQIQANTTSIGEYQCVVSESDGLSITSNAVQLILNAIPHIETQSSDQTACEDNPVTISVNAPGNGLTYQWQYSTDGEQTWKNISGATLADYNFTATKALNGNLYHCLVNGSCGQPAISSTIKLNVKTKPQIIVQPENQAVCDGENVKFYAGATGVDLTYQWQINNSSGWTNISGATDAVYNAIASPTMDGKYYHCIVTGSCGSVVSYNALFTLGVQITTQPTNQTVCDGSLATFGDLTIIGKGPFTYQWQVNAVSSTWGNIPDATNDTYSVYAATSMYGFNYRCVVTSSCGNRATSEAAQLKLFPKTKIETPPYDQTDCEGNPVSFTIDVTGIGLTYQWEQSSDEMQTWNEISGAIAPTYKITPTYAMNNYYYRCKVIGTCDFVRINSDPAKLTVYKNTISPLVASVKTATCEFGTNDGAITLSSVTSDYLPLTYAWSNGAVTPSISALAVNNYKLTVTDSRNCKSTLGRYVDAEAPILSNIKVTDVALPGSATGQIDPRITGGHSPLVYQWSNEATTDIITGLVASTYTLTITDNKQCVKSFAAKVSESEAVNYLTSDQLPNPDDRVLDTTLPVGTLEGTGNVSPSGSATFAIPISILPGIGGMEPKMSIVYNSQSGNGLLGWGWNLTGQSTITRARQDIYHDGKAKGLGIKLDDKYALDGNRLTVVPGETYGTDGSHYKTEIESFSTITAKGDYGGNGPDWFEVKAKNGTIYKYGSQGGRLLYSHTDISSDATVKTEAVLVWYLDYVEDISGNFISYTYEQSGLNTFLKKISYGCNKNNTTEKYNTIELSYAKRMDPIPVHYGSENGKVDIVINKISVKSPNAVYRNYQLDYTKDNFSRLVKVTESAGDGKYFNPTIIKWGKNNSDAITTQNIDVVNDLPPALSDYLYKDLKDQYLTSADVNGDGKSDIVGFYDRYYDNFASTYLSSESTNGSYKFNYGALARLPGGYRYDEAKPGADNMGDINADNKTEIIAPMWNNFFTPSETYFYKFKGDAKGYGKGGDGYIYAGLKASSEVPLYAMADINNDGYDEIVFIEKGTNDNLNYPGKIVYKNNTSVDLNVYKYPSIPIPPFHKYFPIKPEKMFVLDFDGDGMKDIMVLNKAGFWIQKNMGGNEESSFSSNGAIHTDFTSDYVIQPGDFNGDGLPDFLLNKKGTSNWYLAINNGNMGFNLKPLPNITAMDDKDTDKDDDKDAVFVFDFNNDGKSDVVITDAFYVWEDDWYTTWKEFSKFTVSWYKSTGEGFELVNQSFSYNESDAYSKHFATGDFNGDGRTELINYGFDCNNYLNRSQKLRMYSNPNVNSESGVVVSIANGLNQKLDFSYKPLTDNTVYTKPSSPKYPLSTGQPAMYVVSEMKTDDGIGGQSTIAYKYEDVTMNKQGKGFLGFGKITQTNLAANTSVTTKSEFNPKYFTIATQTTETSVNNNVVSRVVNKSTAVPLDGVRLFSYLSTSEATDVVKGNITNAQYLYDKDGHLTQQATNYSCNEILPSSTMAPYFYSAQKKFSNFDSYGNPGDVTSWFLRGSNQSFLQQQSYIYNANGKLDNTTINGVTTSYTYDPFGNLYTVASSASGVQERRDTTEHDPSGIFLTKQSNTLGFQVANKYDESGFGLLTSTTDANGLETTFNFDSWGRPIAKVSPDNKITSSSLRWVDTSDPDVPVNALYYSESYLSEDVKQLFTGAEYFDKLGRSLHKVAVGFNGAKYYTDTKYNNKGQVEEVTEPYPAGESPVKKTLFAYDDYGRLQMQTLPNSVTVSNKYEGNKVTTTYSTGEVYSKTYDGTGQVIKATDPGGSITYSYTALNKPLTIEAPGSTIQISYDPLGRQKSVADPNTGTFTYGYDAFGEQTSQTDPKKKVTLFKYDQLGRVASKTVDTVTTTYTYDQGKRAKGTVSTVQNNKGASMSFMYSNDGLCRTIARTRAKDSESMTYKYSYDELGRMKTVTYPAGFALNYSYNDYDDQTEINDSASNKLIWKVDEVNAKGQLKYATFGNGIRSEYGYDENDRLNRIYAQGAIDFNYKFNDKQQLEYRDENYWADNNWQGFHESFTYDNVNRLETASMNGTETLRMKYQTGVNDRIENKSDIGNYTYQANNHRIDKITTTGDYLPPHQKLTYTTEGMVASITETNNGKINKLLTLEYGADDERFKTEFTQDSARKYTRYYFDTYEKEVKADGTVRNLNYIYAGGQMVAIYEQKPTGSFMHYVYTDYLGSLRCITDSSGTVEQRLSFDPWGNRRNAITGEKLTSSDSLTIGMITSRGFTGHEHLDELGLINMNARIYDPALGMFISADNDLQEPDNTQNFNRYTYCLNNPLMYIDPSGNNFFDWVGSNWKTIAVAAVAIVTTVATAGIVGPIWEDALVNASFYAAVGGMAGGITQAALNGGDWGDMVSSGILGASEASILAFVGGSALGALGKAPLATSKAGDPKPLIDAIGSKLSNKLPSIGSAGAAITPTLNIGGMRATPSANSPDLSRDWLEYNASMNPNGISSRGSLDWVHFDAVGRKTVTSYDALSGSGSRDFFGNTINEGDWTGLELETAPFTKSLDHYAYYNTDRTFGFKVRLEDNFGRSSILIHPGMYNGTQGCIGLYNEDQLMDFYNRMVDYNLSTEKTINIHVTYNNN